MKLKVVASLLLSASALSLAPATAVMGATSLEQRVQQMEQELKELKALMSAQQEQHQQKEAVLETQVAEVVKAHANDGGSKVNLSPNTSFTYGGFVKIDGMYSDYKDGPRPGNIGDEILVPSLIPIGAEGEGAHFDSTVKTSRFFFKTATETDAGLLKSHIEIDFLSGGGDERISNSTNPRIRHAFLDWDYADDASVRIGQTWSTFFNVGALPEAVDFIGPTSGTVFNRQAQIRWTKKLDGGSFNFALENPSTSLADGGSGIVNSDFDDNTIPDIVARYNKTTGNHSWSIAAVGREIGLDSGGMDETDFGVGVNVAGVYKFENGNDFKYSFATGNLGRYVALNAFRDGGIDANGELDLTSITGGYVAYRHRWNEKWRSTLTYALSVADLANGLAATNTERVSNLNLNLMYSPTPKLTFGGEIITANRELENGAEGDLTRLQVTAKYAF